MKSGAASRLGDAVVGLPTSVVVVVAKPTVTVGDGLAESIVLGPGVGPGSGAAPPQAAINTSNVTVRRTGKR